MNHKSYSFKLGDMDCTVLLDGILLMGLERLLRGFPDATEAEYRQAYADIGLSLDEADLSSNILLVKMGDETILVDAGEAGKPHGGLLPQSLEQANIDPKSITLVIITHSHHDHVLGMLTPEQQPAFPNARYVISKAEMDYWQMGIRNGLDHEPIVSMMQDKGLRLIEMDEQIIDGVTAIPLEGHTPGQIGLLFDSNGEQLIHLADALHTPMQFAHPEWSAAFDTDTSVSVPTRRRALGQVADNHLLTMFYHLTFPGLGYVQWVDDTLIWEPLQT